MAKRRKNHKNIVRKLLAGYAKHPLETTILAAAVCGIVIVLYHGAAAFRAPTVPVVTPAPAGITPATPTPTPATPTPVPTLKITPSPIPKHPVATSTQKRAVAARPAPVVAAAPGSSVSGFTPTGPSPSPSPSGGSGSSATPTPTPTMATGYTSTNWSGYLMATGSFTAISGSWTATRPTGVGGTTSADAAWIGIGGVTASDLIQVGTQNIISAGGQVQTAAFYELLPAASQTITALPVAAGDDMSATITQISLGQWTITINDTTTGGSFTKSVAYASSLSSAEWIEEDPSTGRRLIPFDNFGSAIFAGARATVAGAELNLTTGNAQPITMVNRTGATIAVPSAVSSGGDGFSVSP